MLRNQSILGSIILGAIMLNGCVDEADFEQSSVVKKGKPVAAVTKTIVGGKLKIQSEASTQADSSKVFVVDMLVIDTGAVFLTNPRLQYGQAPNELGAPPMVIAELLANDRSVLLSRSLWDPRWTYVWDKKKDRDTLKIAKEASSPLILKFIPGVVSLVVRKDDKLQAELDLSGIIAEFCAKNLKDSDCSNKQD